MKKNYFFAILMVFAIVGMNAQFTDDMESYTTDPIYEGHWGDWAAGGAAALRLSTEQARSGVQSGLCWEDDGVNPIVDAVLDFGNQIFGAWGVEFYMYVPSGKEGYFNVQGITPITAGEWIVSNIYFNQENAAAGHGYIDVDASLDEDPAIDHGFEFPHDAWFRICMNYNLELGMSLATYSMSVDNITVVVDDPLQQSTGDPGTGLGGLDIFSSGAFTRFYVDDFDFRNSYHILEDLGVEDIEAKGFSAYPNPVNDVLNIEADEAITNVSIHNVLGQEVYRANVNALTSSIDMSSFAKGAYFVTVNIGASEGTVKIMK